MPEISTDLQLTLIKYALLIFGIYSIIFHKRLELAHKKFQYEKFKINVSEKISSWGYLIFGIAATVFTLLDFFKILK